MKKFFLTLGFLLVCPSAFALSQRAAEVFDKRNRVMEPPPKSLKANSESKEFRLKTEAERFEKGLQASNDQMETNEVTPMSDGGADNAFPNPQKSSRANLAARFKNRDQLRRGKGFSGDRIFGMGFVGAGAYGIFATEIDFGINDEFAVGGGIGTGMSYSTWGLHTRFYLRQGTEINTFLQFGYANWFMGRAPSSESELAPGYLAQRFFLDRYGRLGSNQRIHLFYPAIGVLYQHESGLAATGQIQYLIHMKDFFGGIAGAVGFHYYF